MFKILIIAQIFIVLILLILVLVQQGNNDGMANLSGSGSNLMSSRGSFNFFHKATIIVGFLFMLNSLLLARITYSQSNAARSLIESIGKKYHNLDRVDESEKSSLTSNKEMNK
jgi:preprotein translocase subunit SecG